MAFWFDINVSPFPGARSSTGTTCRGSRRETRETRERETRERRERDERERFSLVRESASQASEGQIAVPAADDFLWRVGQAVTQHHLEL